MMFSYSEAKAEAEAGGSLWVRGQPGLQSDSRTTAKATQRNSVSKDKQTSLTNWVLAV